MAKKLFNSNEEFEEFISNNGLTCLNENEKNALKNCLNYSYYKELNFSYRDTVISNEISGSRANIITANINLLLLNHLLNIEQQNNQIIELLTEIKNK